MKHKKKFYLIYGLTLLTIAALSVILWQNRLELFIIPNKWKQITDLKIGFKNEVKSVPNIRKIAKRVREIIELQNRDILPKVSTFTIISTKSIENQESFILTFDYDGDYSLPTDNYAPFSFYSQNAILPLSSKGLIIGDPLYAPSFHNHDAWRLYTPKNLQADILHIPENFIVSIDSKGIVPLGFALLDTYEQDQKPNLLPISTGNNVGAETWRRIVTQSDYEVRIPQSKYSESVAVQLLKSSSIGDLHRGLFCLELLGKEYSHHALRLINSKDSYLRARALVIAANSSKNHQTLIPKFETEPKAYAKDALALSLVSSQNVEIAKSALLYILNNKIEIPYEIPIPLKELTSPEITEAVLKILSSNINWKPDFFSRDYIPFLVASKEKDLAPHIVKLHSIWEKLDQRPNESPLVNALAWCIAQLQDPKSVQITIENLKSNSERALITLESIVHSGKVHPTLVPILSEIPKVTSEKLEKLMADRDIIATVALARLDRKESLVLLKNKLLDPKSKWLETSLFQDDSFERTHADRAEVILDMESNDVDGLEIFGGILNSHVLSKYPVAKTIPTLIKIAISNINDQGNSAYQILFDTPEEIYKEYLHNEIKLWIENKSTFDEQEDLVEFLFSLKTKWASQQVLKIFVSDFVSPNIRSIILDEYLENESPPKNGVQIIKTITRIANLKFKRENSTQVKKQSKENEGKLIQKADSNLEFTALLILARWGNEGATNTLFKRIKEPGNTWIESLKLFDYSPKHFNTYFESLIKFDPKRFKTVCEELLDRDGEFGGRIIVR